MNHGVPEIYHNKPLIHVWDYLNPSGEIIGYVARYGTDKKEIIPFFRRSGTGWTPGIDLNPRPLFGLERLANHPKHKSILVVEGEKKAGALQSVNICAVSSLGGANAAKETDWTPLDSFEIVYLLPDFNKPGEHYIRDVYSLLSALQNPPEIKIIRLPDLPEGGDVVDFIQTFIRGWDGYKPLPQHVHEEIIEKLKAELKKAVPVPEEWVLAGLAGRGCSVFDWKTPNKIESEVPPVQALADELIPEPLRGWIVDVSNRMQTPIDFATATSIVVMGSLIGAGCAIRPKKLDDWGVIPNLWGACIGRPSVMLKTPCMKSPMQILDQLQAKYKSLYESAKAENEFDAMEKQAKLENIKSGLKAVAAGKGKDGVVDANDAAVLKASYIEISNTMEPEATRRLFKTNETSIQSMTLIQSQNKRGVLAYRDEMTGQLSRWDREDAADERAYFLEGWNGDGSYTDVKIGRGLTDAESICISFMGGIQPDKLRRYLYQAMKGNNDGLIQRLQLAVWPDEPVDWKLVDAKPNADDKKMVLGIMEILAEMDFIKYGAVKDEGDVRPYFRFDGEGQKVFNDWLTNLQTIKIKNEENPLMVEHLGKYRSLMPSLALNFYLIHIAAEQYKKETNKDNEGGEVLPIYNDEQGIVDDDDRKGAIVPKWAANLAVRWCTYLESHARRIYAMAESPEHEAAVRLSLKIKTGALPSPFTTHDVYHKGWHGLKERLEVEAACNILIDENWLIMQRNLNTLTGRPPAPLFHINPNISNMLRLPTA